MIALATVAQCERFDMPLRVYSSLLGVDCENVFGQGATIAYGERR